MTDFSVTTVQIYAASIALALAKLCLVTISMVLVITAATQAIMVLFVSKVREVNVFVDFFVKSTVPFTVQRKIMFLYFNPYQT